MSLKTQNTKKKDAYASGSERAAALIEIGEFESAARILRYCGYQMKTRNNLAVCLLKTGETDDAIQIFRSFIIESGGVHELAEVNDLEKLNFAIALLVKGQPCGAIAVIDGLNQADHKTAGEIRKAIAKWEKGLGWLSWLNWRVNSISPPNCTIPIDLGLVEFE